MNQFPQLPPLESLDLRGSAAFDQQEEPEIEFDDADILVQREHLGKRPYSRWFGFIFAGGAVCTIVHLSQFFPVMRWFLFFIFLILLIGVALDVNKQQSLAGYISREYLVNLGVMYGAACFVLIAFGLFVLYI